MLYFYLKANPGAHPILHSDRENQYTSRRFHQEAGMVQSMSMAAESTEDGRDLETGNVLWEEI